MIPDTPIDVTPLVGADTFTLLICPKALVDELVEPGEETKVCINYGYKQERLLKILA